ncbi:MAG: hypothetical protein A2W23_04025 [Planctomycetes bacterium RBG_16_43_13]|nr:MAG: hypothetical protein A2W23_04025 [Planctomycetes bacterium RBG_16_43_13]
MKLTEMITENNVPIRIETGKSSVVCETLYRTKESKKINTSLASNDAHVSVRALTFSKIRDVINRLPEVREDRVKSIGNEMLMGENNVSSELVAFKLISEIIIDTLSEE